eukprot:356753-Chlamydomonas_euryale.AAC.3
MTCAVWDARTHTCRSRHSQAAAAPPSLHTRPDACCPCPCRPRASQFCFIFTNFNNKRTLAAMDSAFMLVRLSSRKLSATVRSRNASELPKHIAVGMRHVRKPSSTSASRRGKSTLSIVRAMISLAAGESTYGCPYVAASEPFIA